MTLKEAKKILKKEMVISFHSTKPFVFNESCWVEHEKPSVLEAFRVLAKGGYYISISGHDYNMREKCLKKEYEENTKAPGSTENHIKEYSGVNPALKESASQFNDALLDEQGKKIKHLTKKIARLNKTIRKKNLKIEELKKKLAEKIVDKIDAQALKSAESALAYKEKVIAEKDEVIADLGKELAANEFIKELASLYVLANNKGIINDEMLERCKNYQTYGFPANCNRETKKEINDIARGNENKKLPLFRDDSVGAVTNQKDCSPVKDTHPTEDKPEEVELDEILECVRKALEKGHTVSINYDKAEKGGDQSATIVQCDNGIILSKEEAEIIERCTKNGTELHYSEKDGLTYTNVFGEEMPIRCLRGIFYGFTDEEIENMKK